MHVFFMLFVVSLSFIAQAEPLSLAQIYEIAISQIETVAMQQTQVEASKQKMKLLESAFYPKLLFQIDYTRLDPPTVPDGSPAISGFFDPNQYLTKLNLSLNGIQGGREYYAHKAATLNLKSQESLLDQIKRDLYVQVAQSYFNVLASREDLVNLKIRYDTTRARETDIQHFAQLGRINSSDFFAQKAQVAIAKAAFLQAQQTVILAENNLRIIAGLQPDASAQNDPSPITEELLPARNYLDTIVDRPDIKSLTAQVNSAKASVAVARAAFFPTLDLSANYYPIRSGILATSHYDFGFSFKFPLFDGFANVAQLKTANTTLRMNELLLSQGKRNAEKEIQMAYDQANAALLPLPALKEAVVAAEKDYRRRKQDYERSLTNNLDVNQSLEQMIATKRTYDQGIYLGKTALHVLYAAIGKIP